MKRTFKKGDDVAIYTRARKPGDTDRLARGRVTDVTKTSIVAAINGSRPITFKLNGMTPSKRTFLRPWPESSDALPEAPPLEAQDAPTKAPKHQKAPPTQVTKKRPAKRVIPPASADIRAAFQTVPSKKGQRKPLQLKYEGSKARPLLNDAQLETLDGFIETFDEMRSFLLRLKRNYTR